MWTRATTALLACAGLASGYYHYVHFPTRTGPWAAAPEKFDTGALPNQTVQFFIHEPAGVQLAPTDSVAGLISQIRAGARVWNDVATSDLRIAFGGIVPPGTQFASPVIEIRFDEMPPGIRAYGGPRVIAESNGSFVPIVVSQVVLSRDHTGRPSYSEEFFGTLVHEFGHAVGLQHTLTSSVMSTEITRAITKARPLAADDIAGLSVLYPSRNFAPTTGVITGRVAIGGQGVNLASVVALSPNGPVVSTLTNPDGTYRIEGVPPAHYYVYAHSLPPRTGSEVSPANITYPLTADNQTLPEGPTFDTQFFPGVRDAQQAFPVAVGPGSTTEGVNFSVRARGPLQIHAVETWGFAAQVPMKSPFLSPATPYPFFLGRGQGLLNGTGVAPGLTATVIGGSGLALKPYSAPGFLQLDVDVRSFLATGEGPRHVLFSSPTDTYVLPAAFQLAQNQPPAIAGVASAGDAANRVAILTGAGFNDQTRILFDGVPALRQSFDESGRLLAVPPPARGGHRASVVALNADGQSSLFVSATPATYTYDGDPGAPILAFSPNSLPAGVDAMVTIETPGTTLVDGPVSVGFGSPDIAVRRVWVVNAPSTRLIASVSVSPRASAAATPVTVVNGLQTITQAFSFQTLPANPRAVVLSGQVTNAVAGGTAIASVVNTPAPLNGTPAQLFLNDRPVAFSVTADNQIAFQIPAGTPIGLATLRLQVGGDSSLPVAFAVDPPPPQITSVLINGQAYDPARGLRAGDSLTVFASGMGDVNGAIAPGRVSITIGAMTLSPSQVLPTGNGHGIQFVAPGGIATGNVALTIAIDGRTSAAVVLAVR